MNSLKDISVVVPAYNEEASLEELYYWIKDVCDKNNLSFEVVFIDDGSKDNTWKEIEKIQTNNLNVKGIKFRRNYGKSAALNVGFEHAEGEVVITMDADLQDSPDEIPELRKMILEDGYDLVSGWKKKRHDPISKTLPTKLYNATTRMMSGIKLHDMNCGLKAYKYDVVKSIEVYGEMHRYIPVIAKWAGFDKIGEKVVHHRPRKYGKTKFGMERFIHGFLDLLSIMFISKFGRRPMHLFGALGIIMFIIGFGVSLYMGIDKLFIDTKGKLIADRTEFYIALAAMIMGVQLFLAGFLGEMISRNSSTRNNYLIQNKIGLK
ncbi:MAG: glycosyltransferase family 2 protein [Vicingaceae bacterium]